MISAKLDKVILKMLFVDSHALLYKPKKPVHLNPSQQLTKNTMHSKHDAWNLVRITVLQEGNKHLFGQAKLPLRG